MMTTKQFHNLNRLLAISSAPNTPNQLAVSYSYVYNDANQRKTVTLNNGSYWVYQYDALGQVTSGKKYWADGTPVPGQQFEYGFDDIGNRSSTKAGGDSSGYNLRSARYTVNNLNQYCSRTVPATFDVIGIADAASTVSINSDSTGFYRRGQYFRKELSVANTTRPVWQSVSVTTSGGGSASGNVWVAKTPENYVPDLDGNQTSDGRWNYTWDAENRLIRLVANTATAPQQRIDFEYDWKGRRVGKKVWNNTGGTGTPATYLKFAYDGWNLIAELDGNNANALKRSFIWGLDLSGQSPLSGGAGGGLQGAGCVGGLLAIKPAGANPVFIAYDGNGNITGLIEATTGAATGNFEYGPFGETIRLTPNSNNQSPFRFSTKYTDAESDFKYYGFRYYAPSLGRWLSRDPIGDQAFRSFNSHELREVAIEFEEPNLYAFVRNELISSFDWLGLFSKFIDCNCCQIAALKADEGIAQKHIVSLKSQIQAVLPGILANPKKYPYRTGYKFNTALTKLDKASAKLKSATVVCSKASSPIASADWHGIKMWVYEPYWYYTDFAQGAHLLHEGTHMGSGTTDAAYFWQNRVAPHETFFVPWNSIASTYDSWIIDGFCIPGYNCP